MKYRWHNLVLILILLLGFALRLVDLTDPPIDFHPTRQYRGALIARSIYMDMLPDADPDRQALAAEMRQSFPEFEPPVLETLVAAGYLIAGGEQLWIARVLVSLIWVLGGAVLFALVRRTTSTGPALLALAYYLFLQFSVYASRSFQPDPVMTVWVICTVYAAFRWSEGRSWQWALMTSLFAVLAVIAKIVAAYLIGAMLIALLIKVFGLKEAVKDRQVWAMAMLMFILPGLYYLLGIGDSSSNYFENWMIKLMPLVLTKDFYIGWVKRLFGFSPIPLVAAGLGVLLFAKGKSRWMLWGLWIGYAIYGFTLPHQTMTHNYYHVQLIPIVAWSLAFTAHWIFDKLEEFGSKWQWVFIFFALLTSIYPAYRAVNTLMSEDHRHEPPFWEFIGEQVPKDGETIGLVQQYGHLLMYYGWVEVELWPVSGELDLAELRGNPNIDDFPTFFSLKTAGMDYFLVTSFNQFERQNELYDYLYANYPIYEEGISYLIFDLRK